MEKTINIGDKVRFLNDIGGGKVTGFQRGGIVLVEDEDGFEIPVREQEVVLVSNSEKKLTQKSAPIVEEEESSEPTYRVRTILASKNSQVHPISMNVVNNNIHTTQGAYNQPDSYTNDEMSLEERIMHLERTVKKLQLRIEQLEVAKSLREKLESSGYRTREMKTKDNSSKKQDIIEIDLHATELLDTTAGMSPTDIKDYQINIFRRTMDEHLKDKGQRIVFIHGNGEGVLRRAIVDELRRNYKRCDYQDASYQQYGFGATMVTIH